MGLCRNAMGKPGAPPGIMLAIPANFNSPLMSCGCSGICGWCPAINKFVAGGILPAVVRRPSFESIGGDGVEGGGEIESLGRGIVEVWVITLWFLLPSRGESIDSGGEWVECREWMDRSEWWPVSEPVV